MPYSITTESVVHYIQFRSAQRPHEMIADLERRIRTVFAAQTIHNRLLYAGSALVNRIPYRLELEFLSAHPGQNHYLLRTVAPLGDSATWTADSVKSWIEFWTSGLAESSGREGGDEALYAKLLAEARLHEQEISTVEQIQSLILQGMKRGARFVSMHKEGGTTISYRFGSYQFADFGESSGSTSYHSDLEFLAALYRFFAYDVQFTAGPDDRSDINRWRLLYRLMDHE